LRPRERRKRTKPKKEQDRASQRNRDAADEGEGVLADQEYGASLFVMAGLVPAIHVFVSASSKQDVDHRVKPCDDDPILSYPAKARLRGR